MRSVLEIAHAPPLETVEQQSYFTWADFYCKKIVELCDLYAVPNGAWKSPAQAGKFQREGLRPGVPDIVLPHARGGYHALYIEMKRRRIRGKSGVLLAGDKPSPQQLDWHERLRAAGNCVVVAYGWDEAVEATLKYLGS